MKTLTDHKSLLLANAELRLMASIESYEADPTRETLDRMETAAITVANLSRKEHIPISAVVADIVSRAKHKRREPEPVVFADGSQGRNLADRELFVMIATVMFGFCLLCALGYGLFKMFEMVIR